MNRQKNILVAPLNWGLGHATRCIPLINELLTQGANVIIGSDGRSLNLLRMEYPQLESLELPAYNPIYPAHGRMGPKMFFQLRKFLSAIRKEHEQLEQMIKDKKLDAVISDNRYGLWHDEIPSAFMTHQLNILLPKGYGWLQKRVNKTNLKYIKQFDECWVPDFEGDKNLSGKLSHGKFDLEKLIYIGPLSRLKGSTSSEPSIDLLAILSGPEPQRTILEEKILLQLRDFEGTCSIVRGITENRDHIRVSDKIEFINYMTSVDLENAMQKASLVLCRAGYSSVMDLAAMNKKAILIPTPGQTEQKYLAKHLEGTFYFIDQDHLELNRDIDRAKNHTEPEFKTDPSLLTKTVVDFLQRI